MSTFWLTKQAAKQRWYCYDD